MAAQSSLAVAEFYDIGAIAGALNHNSRVTRPVNADPSRTKLNRVVKGKDVDEYNVHSAIKTACGLERFNKNAILLYEVVLELPVEKQAKLERWLKETVAWAEKNLFGTIIRADAHLDEANPHLHLLVVPTGLGNIPELPKEWRRNVYGAATQGAFVASKATQRKPRSDAGKLCGGRILRRAYKAFLQESYADHMLGFGVKSRTKGAAVSQQRREQYAAAVKADMPVIRVQSEHIPEPPMFAMTKEQRDEYRQMTASAVNESLKAQGLAILTDQARHAKLLEQRDVDRKAALEWNQAHHAKLEANYAAQEQRFKTEAAVLGNENGKLRDACASLSNEIAEMKAKALMPSDEALVKSTGAATTYDAEKKKILTSEGDEIDVIPVEDGRGFRKSGETVPLSGIRLVETILTCSRSEAAQHVSGIFGPQAAANLLIAEAEVKLRRMAIPKPPAPNPERTEELVADLKLKNPQVAETISHALSGSNAYLDDFGNFVGIKRSFTGEQTGWFRRTPAAKQRTEFGEAFDASFGDEGCLWAGCANLSSVVVVADPNTFLSAMPLAASATIVCLHQAPGALRDMREADVPANRVRFLGFRNDNPAMLEFQSIYQCPPLLTTFEAERACATKVSSTTSVDPLADGYYRIEDTETHLELLQ